MMPKRAAAASMSVAPILTALPAAPPVQADNKRLTYWVRTWSSTVRETYTVLVGRVQGAGR